MLDAIRSDFFRVPATPAEQIARRLRQSRRRAVRWTSCAQAEAYFRGASHSWLFQRTIEGGTDGPIREESARDG
jgi:hypothetical protein